MLVFIALFGGMVSFRRLQAARAGLLVEDELFTTYGNTGRYARRRGFWARLFKRGGETRRPVRPIEFPEGRPSPNPNPGAWETKQDEQARLDAEVDRILRKVSERGVHSLSYVERQTLERATRERQERERDFERETRL